MVKIYLIGSDMEKMLPHLLDVKLDPSSCEFRRLREEDALIKTWI